MSIIKNKNQFNNQVEDEVAPIDYEANESAPVEHNEVAQSAIFVPKTERAANCILVKINEIIKELKIEIANSEPRYDDLDTYVEALKSDLVNVVILRDHFKRKY